MRYALSKGHFKMSSAITKLYELAKIKNEYICKYIYILNSYAIAKNELILQKNNYN